MNSPIPATSNIFFDDFCVNFFGGNLNTSSSLQNPLVVFPNNVQESLNNGGNTTVTITSSSPQVLKIAFPSSNITSDVVLLQYKFDYSVDLSSFLDNISTTTSPNTLPYTFIAYTLSYSNVINFTLRFMDVLGNKYDFSINLSTPTPPSLNSPTLMTFTNGSKGASFDAKRVVTIQLLTNYTNNSSNIGAQDTVFIYVIGFLGYPLVPVSRCYLYDNFTQYQDTTLANPNLLNNSDGSWNYTVSPGSTTTRIIGTSGASSSLVIFGNSASAVSDSFSPAAAYFTLNPSSMATLTYGDSNKNFYLSGTGTGVIVYVIYNFFPGPNESITISVNASGKTLNSRVHTKPTITELEFLGFTIPPGNIQLQVEIVSAMSQTAYIYLCYIMVWKQSVMEPQPNFFLDKTYNYILTNNSNSVITNPYGVFPTNTVTRTFISGNNYKTTEDYASIIVNWENGNLSGNIIEYDFSSSIDLSAIQNFVIFATTNVGNTGTNYEFEVVCSSGSNNFSVISNSTLNGDSGPMSILKLNAAAVPNSEQILPSIEKIQINISTSATSGDVRIYAITCEYDCNSIPFFDNFTLYQLSTDTNGSPVITDHSFNYTGNPYRTLETLSDNKNIGSVITSMNSFFTGFTPTFEVTFKYLTMAGINGSLNNSTETGNCSYRVIYNNINLNNGFIYDFTFAYFLSAITSPGTINKFSFGITDVDTGNILLTNQNLEIPQKKDILFTTSLAFTNNIQIEFIINVTLPGTGNFLVNIPYLILQANANTCVLEGTHIVMADKSLKKIEEIQRGDLVLTTSGVLPVCRVIRERLNSKISLCKIAKGVIDGSVPYNDLYLCTRHVIRYNGKRRLATALRGFKGVETLIGPRNEITSKLYMYDLQFEVETFYYAEGLESQSRSPFCHLSPLPKELYFHQEFYADIQVPDCLTDDKFENNWPNIENRFSWRTFLAKYILAHPEVQIKPEEFTEQKALELRNGEIDLSEIIPDDFDWKEYTSVHKDLRGIKTEMDACLHWVRYGHEENRCYMKYPYV